MAPQARVLDVLDAAAQAGFKALHVSINTS